MRFFTEVFVVVSLFVPFAFALPSEELSREVTGKLTAEIHLSDYGIVAATPEELAKYNLTEPSEDMNMSNGNAESAPWIRNAACISWERSPSAGDVKALVEQFKASWVKLGRPSYCALKKPDGVDWNCCTAREHVGIAWVEACSNEHRYWPCHIYWDTAAWVLNNCGWSALASGYAEWGHWNGHTTWDKKGFVPHDLYRITFYNLYQYHPERFPSG